MASESRYNLRKKRRQVTPAVIPTQKSAKKQKVHAVAEPFPFMKLPAELRIHIYHMALQRDEPLLLHVARPSEKADEELPSINGATKHRQPNGTIVINRYVPPELRNPLPRLGDPISPALLRANKLIYKEARQVLYADNMFTLFLTSGVYTLATLHQRSRSLIKHVILTIPSHHDILDGFSDLVRTGLRYCWGLKTLKIVLKACLPDDGHTVQIGSGNVYANAFHILRWLPRGCRVELEGPVSASVRKVVEEEGRQLHALDESSYLKRQHQMP